MRTEIINAENSSHTITIVKINEDVTIKFNFNLSPPLSPRFILPSWAMGKEEEYEFQGGFKLKPDSSGIRDIIYSLQARIKNYNELIFVCKSTDTYRGEFQYKSQALKDSGVIMNGIRLNCIASIGSLNFATLMDAVRNHQGDLIVSTTLDTKRKRTFNITTVPLTDTEYRLYPDVYCNTIEEFEKVLYKDIGGYKTFTVRGIDYTVVLKDDVTETSQTAIIDGKIKDCIVYSFNLEEV